VNYHPINSVYCHNTNETAPTQLIEMA